MARLRRLPGGAAVLAINALLAIAALGLAFAEPGEGHSSRLRLASASGSLSLSNSSEAAAILSSGAMRPGEAVSGTVRIANTGSQPGALALARTAGAVDVPGAGGGRLSDRLQLLVLDVTTAALPATVYSGRLDAMPTTAVGTVAPGGERSFRFVATLPAAGAADNAYQGASLAAGFTWTAVGREAPVSAPASAPESALTPPAPTSPESPPQPPLAAPAPTPTPTVDTDPTGTVLGEQVFALPSAKGCVSRRRFKIHVRRPRGLALASLQITVNRRTKVRLKGLAARRVKASISVRGLPKGKVVVKIVAVTTTGQRAVSTRTYRTCASKRTRP